jgi:tetratricopeptide (TPR) repeat protein
MKTVAIFILLMAAATARAEENPAFVQANQDYANRNFQKAIDGYQQLVSAGKWSANLFYDLGNAWYRAGDAGKAILNYERALALEPHHPEAQANLRLVRDQARALELRQTPVQRYLSFATANQFTVVASCAFWFALFAAAGSVFSRRSAKRIALLLLAMLLFASACAGAYVLERGARGATLAIVTAKKVDARVATADTSGTVLTLPPGSEINILSARGDWLYVALPNDQRGWIPANAAEAVRF